MTQKKHLTSSDGQKERFIVIQKITFVPCSVMTAKVCLGTDVLFLSFLLVLMRLLDRLLDLNDYDR